jgi:hypothetical protein
MVMAINPHPKRRKKSWEEKRKFPNFCKFIDWTFRKSREIPLIKRSADGVPLIVHHA